MTDSIQYRTTLEGVDWPRLKSVLAADHFDNGRTPDQLRESFERSFAVVLACTSATNEVVGTARVLSDGICNAYIVDLWTLSAYRRRGIARAMLRYLEARLSGQHVYLFTEDRVEFYEKCGYTPRPVGLDKVVGRWLDPTS